ncbi:MAG: stage III sporulation protein D [Ruminococcaceae bacterium]|nr:stage III sporulation protein D [Oscillospiraceae bacterium]
MFEHSTCFVFNGGNRERCEIIADHIIKNRCTVRSAANHFGISKSTIHKDITKNLKNVNLGKFNEVKEIIEINKSERHIRGGLATKIKYQKLRKTK